MRIRARACIGSTPCDRAQHDVASVSRGALFVSSRDAPPASHRHRRLFSGRECWLCWVPRQSCPVGTPFSGVCLPAREVCVLRLRHWPARSRRALAVPRPRLSFLRVDEEEEFAPPSAAGVRRRRARLVIDHNAGRKQTRKGQACPLPEAKSETGGGRPRVFNATSADRRPIGAN